MTEAFEPVEEWPCQGATHKVYRFPNGYGASVVAWDTEPAELRVVRWHRNQYRLDYSTPITLEAIGRPDDDEIQDLLERVRALPFGGVS
ncbi:MAG: putative bacteriophage protein [Actinomycetia bacterium]|nr:putative bacteriophage protein [Actinomycetes bacterium]